MEQLKMAWVYRFWIVIGTVLLLLLVGIFFGTGNVKQEADAKRKTLNSEKSLLERLAKGPNYNDSWSTKIKELETELRKDVDGAWESLYARQKQFRTWPPGIGDVFEQQGRDWAGDLQHLIQFRDAYRSQFDDLVDSLRPIRGDGSGGVVELKKDLTSFQPAWVNETLPTTVPEIWLAQEDIWILRALFDVVSRANGDSREFRTSPVKRILELEIGGEAAVDESVTDELRAPNLAGVTQSVPGRTTKGRSAGRYIPSRDEKLFKLVPIYMSLVVDQRKAVEILAEFASSGIPMQISKVSFAARSERPKISVQKKPRGARKKRANEDLGLAPAKEDEYFHMAELQVWARAFLFNPAPSVQQAQQKVAARSTES